MRFLDWEDLGGPRSLPVFLPPELRDAAHTFRGFGWVQGAGGEVNEQLRSLLEAWCEGLARFLRSSGAGAAHPLGRRGPATTSAESFSLRF